MKDLSLYVFSHNSSQRSVLDWHDLELSIIEYWKVVGGFYTITKTKLDSIPRHQPGYPLAHAPTSSRVISLFIQT